MFLKQAALPAYVPRPKDPPWYGSSPLMPRTP
jgi:hypothetical protein